LKEYRLKKAGLIPAFTMIELIFVIVVIGILSAIAIPRLAATRTDAIIVKGKSQVAAVRSGIVMQKSQNLLQGNRQTNGYYPDNLDDINSSYGTVGQKLFFHNDGNSTNILENPTYSKNDSGGWLKTNTNTYTFQIISGTSITFTYNPATGSFDCDHTIQNCKDLTE
jgi:general secretion pathway protein G